MGVRPKPVGAAGAAVVSALRSLHGFLVIWKPAGLPTRTLSNVLLALVHRGVRIGHVGTLDPAASGVVVLSLGRARKLIPFLSGVKEYDAVVKLGLSTATDDATGQHVQVQPAPPCADALHASVSAALAAMIQPGRPLQQVPPVFSAVRSGGERAYKIARRQVRDAAVASAAAVALPSAGGCEKYDCSPDVQAQRLRRLLPLSDDCSTDELALSPPATPDGLVLSAKEVVVHGLTLRGWCDHGGPGKPVYDNSNGNALRPGAGRGSHASSEASGMSRGVTAGADASAHTRVDAHAATIYEWFRKGAGHGSAAAAASEQLQGTFWRHRDASDVGSTAAVVEGATASGSGGREGLVGSASPVHVDGTWGNPAPSLLQAHVLRAFEGSDRAPAPASHLAGRGGSERVGIRIETVPPPPTASLPALTNVSDAPSNGAAAHAAAAVSGEGQQTPAAGTGTAGHGSLCTPLHPDTACPFPELHLSLTVGAGFYVRSLARDLGRHLGLPSTLASLVRTSSNGFSGAHATPLYDLTRTGVLTPPVLRPSDAPFLGTFPAVFLQPLAPSSPRRFTPSQHAALVERAGALQQQTVDGVLANSATAGARFGIGGVSERVEDVGPQVPSHDGSDDRGSLQVSSRLSGNAAGSSSGRDHDPRVAPSVALTGKSQPGPPPPPPTVFTLEQLRATVMYWNADTQMVFEGSLPPPLSGSHDDAADDGDATTQLGVGGETDVSAADTASSGLPHVDAAGTHALFHDAASLHAAGMPTASLRPPSPGRPTQPQPPPTSPLAQSSSLSKPSLSASSRLVRVYALAQRRDWEDVLGGAVGDVSCPHARRGTRDAAAAAALRNGRQPSSSLGGGGAPVPSSSRVEPVSPQLVGRVEDRTEEAAKPTGEAAGVDHLVPVFCGLAMTVSLPPRGRHWPGDASSQGTGMGASRGAEVRSSSTRRPPAPAPVTHALLRVVTLLLSE